MIEHDVLIIGGGLAGLRMAVGLSGKWDVVVVSKVHPVRSHSGAAQGGMNAALGNASDGRDDSPARHAFDTIKGSDYLADQSAVVRMCELGPEVVVELEHWGAPFSRFEDGSIAQRPFGGAGFPRTCYAADRTGHILLHTLYERALARDVRIYDERVMTRLVVHDGHCHGIIAYDLRTGRFESLGAKYCCFATGGYGRIYGKSSNALINTGSGIGAALSAGIPVKDLEFVQFHPTTLFGTNILITEGARGEGGYLVNRDGRRFMEDYAPKAMELAPRDIVARSIQTEIDEGRGFEGEYVHLDLRHLGRKKILKRLPGIRDICMDFGGIDPIETPIPVQPGQHYSMGGIDTNAVGRTRVPNFYAVGECACVSVHGANRLGGNSLLDTVVFGRLAAEDIARENDRSFRPDKGVLREALREQSRLAERLLSRAHGIPQHEIRNRLREVCSEQVGIYRDASQLEGALAELLDLRTRYEQVRCRSRPGPFQMEILDALELEDMLHLAEIGIRGALAREESRGSHYRTDFPKRDDIRWLKHTVAHLADGDDLEITYTDVDLTHHEPQERTY